MAKAAFIPKHYSLVLTPDQTLELILTLRFCRVELVTGEAIDEVLGALEEAYAGELPQSIGPPIDAGDGDGETAAAA